MTHYDQRGNSVDHESFYNDSLGISRLFTSELRFIGSLTRVVFVDDNVIMLGVQRHPISLYKCMDIYVHKSSSNYDAVALGAPLGWQQHLQSAML
jgi:hypothetical protein